MAEKKRRIVFVCTGNTCRSPMAQCILRAILRREHDTGYTVTSCGIAADVGAPMTPEAVAALAEHRIRVGAHKARAWKPAYAKPGTLVVAMTEAHKARLPYCNVFSIGELTDGGDVGDPFGGSLDSYRACRDRLEVLCELLYRNVLRP